MASKKQLVQSEILAQATIAQPATGFVSFGSKTTGLYQRLGAGADEKLLTEADNLAPSILTKIKTVDGAGSGLDADLLDGYLHATEVKRQTNSVTNNLGTPSVEEMALFHGQFTNKMRFFPATLQEQSADGISWINSNRASVDQLKDIMLGEGQTGGFSAIPITAAGQSGHYRLTWDAPGYCSLQAFYCYGSANGNNVDVKIEKYNVADGWTIVTSGVISGWPEHTFIPHDGIWFLNNAPAQPHHGKVRVTFKITSSNTAYPFDLSAIEWFGGYPAGRRNIEYYDRDQNVYFPARVQGTRLAATVANGTSPMDITSQTLVSNLNADLLEGYHGATAATANTAALRDASADIACRLLRPNYTDEATISGAMAFRIDNGGNNYVRFCNNISAIKTYLQAASSKLVGSANIDSYLGDGLFEFDPVPTGTPPISSPNIRVLSIGRESRNTQMAFNYASDQAWFRRKTDSVWSGWCEFYHSGNLSTFFTALKTIDGHGSGLDADLLDGKHADEFALANIIVVQNAHGFAVGNAIKLSGSTWVKAKADSAANAGTVGLVSQVIDANSFKYITGGLLAGAYTSGANYFLSPDTAGLVFIQSDPEQWNIGNVREFIGTGTSAGLLIEIDLGVEIQEAVVPTSIWDLTDVDRTGWATGKVLKFNASGNLVVGIDIEGTGATGITLASLSAVSPIAYNSATGAFSIATGYVVPTTGQKANYDLAYGWGNHANAGYLTAITKAMVEAVLTGVINTHTHNYDNYGYWNIVTEEPGSAQSIASASIVAFQNTECIKFSKVAAGNVAYMYATLRLDLLTAIVNPTTSHFIPIMSTGGAQSKITILQLQGLIGGGGGGGTSDHAALTNLTYDASGHTGFARLAGSSSQAFATANLSTTGTIVATGTITGSEVYRGSARKLKKNIKPLKIDALAILSSVLICEYDLRESGGHYIGFIADDTHELLSGDGKDKHLFGNHLALLTKAIQEQDKQIAELKNEISELRTLLNEFKNGR